MVLTHKEIFRAIDKGKPNLKSTLPNYFSVKQDVHSIRAIRAI